MLLVKSIDIVNVSRNRVDLAIAHRSSVVRYEDSDGNMDQVPIELVQESIQGERFVLPNGDDVYIGFSEKVRDALMLPLGVYDDLKAKNEYLRNQLVDTEEELKKAKSFGENMTLQERISFLGTGRI